MHWGERISFLLNIFGGVQEAQSSYPIMPHYGRVLHSFTNMHMLIRKGTSDHVKSTCLLLASPIFSSFAQFWRVMANDTGRCRSKTFGNNCPKCILDLHSVSVPFSLIHLRQILSRDFPIIYTVAAKNEELQNQCLSFNHQLLLLSILSQWNGEQGTLERQENRSNGSIV